MKTFSLEELHRAVDSWKAAGLRVGFTCGAFDLLHAGHVDYLQRSRELCDRLIVALNSDQSIREYKDAGRPFINEEQRVKVISALSCVDATILMPDLRPARLLEVLKPDLYIKGGDYSRSGLRSASLVESYGGQCVVIPVNHEISTSIIVNRIQQQYLNSPVVNQQQEGRPKIAFLDRDGTLIANEPFLRNPAHVSLLPGVLNGLKTLQQHNFLLVLVTNQQGLGLGYFTYDDFIAVNAELLRQLGAEGIKISRVYFCPHSLSMECECRKPKPKLLLDAMTYFRANPEECFMVGDTLADLQAAQNAGCKGFLVAPAPGPDSHANPTQTFEAAVGRILEHSLALQI